MNTTDLLDIERRLNFHSYNGVQLGSILSMKLRHLYLSDNKRTSLFSLFFLSIFRVLKGVISYKKKIIIKSTFYYFQTSDKPHYKSLLNAIIKDNELKSSCIVINNFSSDKKLIKLAFYNNDVIDVVKSLHYLLLNHKEIYDVFKTYHTNFIEFFDIIHSIYIQLMKVQSLEYFLLNQNNVLLIGGDYDRGWDSSVWFSVAKSRKIFTFSLQHGVINPPYGYNPIIADEIWVWGEKSKFQLLQCNVYESYIRITGTPIIRKIDFNENSKIIQRAQYKLSGKKTIVLALSSNILHEDIKAVSFLREIKNEYNDKFHYLVKIHPSKSIKNFSWIVDDYGFDIIDPNISFENFLYVVDVLLTRNSGIADETLYYSKSVGILDLPFMKPGNSNYLHEILGVPLIRTVKDIDKLITNPISLDVDKLFFKIDEDAEFEISSLVKSKLTSL
jgi:hypothetical protein